MSYSAFLFFQAEDGIRDLVRSRGLGDVYKRQVQRVYVQAQPVTIHAADVRGELVQHGTHAVAADRLGCLLYTSDAADERSSVDLGGRRIIKKKKKTQKKTHCEMVKKERLEHMW